MEMAANAGRFNSPLASVPCSRHAFSSAERNESDQFRGATRQTKQTGERGKHVGDVAECSVRQKEICMRQTGLYILFLLRYYLKKKHC